MCLVENTLRNSARNNNHYYIFTSLQQKKCPKHTFSPQNSLDLKIRASRSEVSRRVSQSYSQSSAEF